MFRFPILLASLFLFLSTFTVALVWRVLWPTQVRSGSAQAALDYRPSSACTRPLIAFAFDSCPKAGRNFFHDVDARNLPFQFTGRLVTLLGETETSQRAFDRARDARVEIKLEDEGGSQSSMNFTF
jgi:hypothetical protein